MLPALRELLARAPDVLASTPHAAKLVRPSVLAGRMPVVELLLNKGVDMNKPSPLALVPSRDFETLICVTPLCAARRGPNSLAEIPAREFVRLLNALKAKKTKKAAEK